MINGAGVLFLVMTPDKFGRYVVMGISAEKPTLDIPGGRFDEEDGDLVNTAVREALEEVGIDSSLSAPLKEYLRSHKKNIITYTSKDGNFSFTAYVVKIPSFDFAAANNAATKRLQTFHTLSKSNPSAANAMAHLVEMKGFMPLTINGDIESKTTKFGELTLRSRDAYILHNDRTLELLSRIAGDRDVPVFTTPLIFI